MKIGQFLKMWPFFKNRLLSIFFFICILLNFFRFDTSGSMIPWFPRYCHLVLFVTRRNFCDKEKLGILGVRCGTHMHHVYMALSNSRLVDMSWVTL